MMPSQRRPLTMRRPRRRQNEARFNAAQVTASHGKSTTRVIVECALILLSVGVGYVAAQFGEYRQERQLAATVLRGLQTEVATNLALLETMVDAHSKWRDALENVDIAENQRAGYEVLFITRPDGADIGLPLSNAAWNMAVSTGALRLLDYEVASAVSEIYEYQMLMTENHNRTVMASLYTPTTFDPAQNAVVVRMLWGMMGEIAGNERALRELYQKHMQLLQQASID